MKKISLIAALVLGGCTTGQKVVSVSKPISGHCIPDAVRQKPNYPDTAKALMDAKSPAERYKLLFAGRSVRIDRINELEVVIGDCP